MACHLATLARITFLSGEYAKAIDIAQRALDSGAAAEAKKTLQEQLDAFRVGKVLLHRGSSICFLLPCGFHPLFGVAQGRAGLAAFAEPRGCPSKS
jgi:hypothetical protein